jgi:hypothetical protein
MGPYRTPPEPTSDDEAADDGAGDDRIIGYVLLAIGGVRLVFAVAASAPFGTEPTVALLMVAAAIVVLAGAR